MCLHLQVRSRKVRVGFVSADFKDHPVVKDLVLTPLSETWYYPWRTEILQPVYCPKSSGLEAFASLAHTLSFTHTHTHSLALTCAIRSFGKSFGPG